LFTMKKIIASTLLGVMLVQSASPSYALNLTEKQKNIQQKQAQNSTEQRKANTSIQQREQDITLEEQKLNDLESELQDIINEVTQKKAEIRTTQKKIAQIQTQIKEFQKKMSSQKTLMEERMVTMQKNGGSSINWAEFIFGSKDFGDLVSRMITAGTIQENDQELFKEYQSTKNKLQIAKAELDTEKDKLISQKEELENSQKKLNGKIKVRAAQIKKLEAEKIQFTSKLVSLQQMESTLQEQEKSIQAEIEAQRLEEQAKIRTKEAARKAAEAKSAEKNEISENKASLEKSPNSEKVVNTSKTTDSLASPTSGGVFQRPTSGIVTQGWGPAGGANGYSFHNALDTAGPVGTPIMAAQTGTVTRAGWGGPYGNHVIITHVIGGQVWTTLYAHMSSLSVSAGQRVTRGQNIGAMGSTGNSTGSHLHFEVHRGNYSYSATSAGNTVNPSQFF